MGTRYRFLAAWAPARTPWCNLSTLQGLLLLGVVDLMLILLLLLRQLLLLLLLLFVVMVLVDLACEDALYGVPQAQFLLVVALHVVLVRGLVLSIFGG